MNRLSIQSLHSGTASPKGAGRIADRPRLGRPRDRISVTRSAAEAAIAALPADLRCKECVDDRRVLNGIIWRLRTGAHSADIPARYGPHPTCGNRIRRWRKRGIWMGWRYGCTRQQLRPGSPVRPWRERGARAQAIAPSRGDQTTKIYARTDVLGRPSVLLLTPGNASDVTTAPAVLAEAPGLIRRLSANKHYDVARLRTDLRNSVVTPVIPGKRGRKRLIRHVRSRSRECWCIEAMFNRLPDFRRIGPPNGKLARNYATTLSLAAIVTF